MCALVKVALDAHHVVLWDGAGFHQPPASAEPEWADLANLHPFTLPPYCMELNPTEMIWDQLKDGVCNKVFDGIEEMGPITTKTLSALDVALLPVKVRRQLLELIEGDFADRAANKLAFGLHGRG